MKDKKKRTFDTENLENAKRVAVNITQIQKVKKLNFPSF